MSTTDTTARPNQCLVCGHLAFRQTDQWATDGRPGAHPVVVIGDEPGDDFGPATVHKGCRHDAAYSRKAFAEDSAWDDAIGAYRWVTSGNVIPEEVLHHCGFDAAAVARQAEARRVDTAEFLARARTKPLVISEEEMFEMRAAFGPGERVVNVLTGQSIQL